MKKVLAREGALALTPASFFADHLEPQESEINPSEILIIQT